MTENNKKKLRSYKELVKTEFVYIHLSKPDPTIEDV